MKPSEEPAQWGQELSPLGKPPRGLGLFFVFGAMPALNAQQNDHSAHSLPNKGQPQPCLCCAGTGRGLSVN